MQKGFSIIVCCYNSCNRIGKTVQYLTELSTEYFGFEVIIVDNNSSDNTYEAALRIADATPDFNISVIREFATGRSNAVIAGVSKAVYEYIVLCDDDNWLSPNYLLVAWKVMQGDLRIGILGGRGVIHSNAVLPAWFPNLENAWAVGKQSDQSGEVSSSPKAVWGAGMVIRKQAWDRLGPKGFPRFLMVGRKGEDQTMSGEDTELCILIQSMGYKIFYEDDMWYYHDVHTARINWKTFKKLWEGFAKSSIYFDMYQFYFEQDRRFDNCDVRKKINREFSSNAREFFHSSSLFNFFRVLYITFIEDRPGYLPGLQKRKLSYRLKELWRIRKTYGESLKTISLSIAEIDKIKNNA